MITKPEAIIFDWDNTLCNTAPIIDKSLMEICIKTGKGESFMIEMRKFNGVSMKNFFPILFGDKWQEVGKSYLQLYSENSKLMLSLLPDRLELIKFFYKKNIPLFILSNKTSSNLRQEISQLNLNKYFHTITGSGDSEFDKPHFKAVNFCLKNTNINPKHNHVWLIGDTEIDLKCALDSQCLPILINEKPSEKAKQILNDHKKIKYFPNISKFNMFISAIYD